jgi:tRNA(adenine34) deaminase
MNQLDPMEFDDESWLHDQELESLGDEHSDEHWMRQALKLAQQAAEQDEVPVGAVIVHKNKIIASAFNQREQLADPTAHAEMIAITQAASHLNSWRLLDCSLFVTLEPCPMCAGAILQSRIPRIVYGALDPKAGAVVSLYQLLNDPRLNHRCETLSGVLANECGRILTEFFDRKRKLGKK